MPEDVRIRIMVECDACGARWEAVMEDEAAKEARRHAEHCRACHKGVHL